MRRRTEAAAGSRAGDLAVFGLALAFLRGKLVLLSVGLDAEPFPTERHVQSATLAAVLLLGAPLALLPRGRTAGALLLNALVTSLALADAVHFVWGKTYCRPNEIRDRRSSGPNRKPGCWSVTSGDRLDPGPFAAQVAQARTHLEVSDLVVEGDLIPRR